VVFFLFGFGERFVLSASLGDECSATGRSFLCKSLKAGVCPNGYTLWYIFTKEFPVGQPFVMTSAWFSRRYQQDALVLISYDDALPGVRFLLTGIGAFVGFGSLRTLDGPFSAVNEDIFDLRELLEQFLYGANLSFRELDLFAKGLL
jgi:hypothetical protein